MIFNIFLSIFSWFIVFCKIYNSLYMFWRSPTATTDNVYQSFIQIFFYLFCCLLGSFVILSKSIRKPSIWVSRNPKVSLWSDSL